MLLAIHGRPGVGKTALAQRLALRLVGEYPDGQLYQNMGAEGRAREPREILLSLLGQLQWPEAEMLGKKEIDAAELAGTFRAKTAGKRMLIVLDAVRSRAQLLQVLPGTSTCTVIITSRANLHAGGQPSHRLGPVTPEEATEIFLTACGNGRANKVNLVAEAIELCDFQPNALLSAGERARDERLERTLERLRNEEDRLNALTYGLRNVGDRIASEYNNLEDLEKRAFLLLTLPESETFVPWALQPLMREIGSVQAGNLMAEISKVGLLEIEGKDPSGFGRYRFSPLARLFAEQRLQAGDIPAAEVNEARERFRRVYLAGSLKVLHQAGFRGLPTVPFPVPNRWYPEVPDWEDQVASSIDFWAHAEFGNLIRSVLEAARYDLSDACWQLAVHAAICFSPPARHADIKMAFEVALMASRQSSDPVAAEIQVRLARSGYLTAVHDYLMPLPN